MKSLFLWTLFVLLITGCGQSNTSEADEKTAARPAQVENPVEVVDGVTIVRMTGNDQMKYNLDAFTVTAGSTVRLIFTNIGKMPKAAMGHNVVFLNADVNANVFATEAARARDQDYIPVESSDQMIAHTKLLGPGETDTIEFTAPQVAGAYPFICSFPAHLFAGMRGVMTVE